MNKIILTQEPSRGFKLLKSTDLLAHVFPELLNLSGIETINGKSHKDNFLHTLQVLDNISAHTDSLWLRWAAIMHDIAKPATKRFDKKVGWTFHGHEELGAKMVPRIFKYHRLPLDSKMKYVQKLVRLHLRPIALVKGNVTDTAIRRLLNEAGNDIDDLMKLCNADITSKNEFKVKKFRENFKTVSRKLEEVEAKDQIRNFQPPVTGEDIMRTFSIGPCYEIGVIKSRIKGKFRTKGLRTTNPLAVGDYVQLTKNEIGEYIVDEIQERNNYIIRKSVNLSKEAHIIASNIDLAVLLVTVSNPVTATGFIDRFTVTAEAYHIPLHIVFNKIDLYDDTDKITLHEWESTYTKANYNTLCISAKTGEGLSELSDLIADKTTLIAGNSGAGKSTLINQIIPNLALKTGDISTTHMTGKHTTTFAEMFDVNEGTRIIDTPGIKGCGLVDFEK